MIFASHWATHPLILGGVEELLETIARTDCSAMCDLVHHEGNVAYYAAQGVPLVQLLGTARGPRAAAELLAGLAEALGQCGPIADADDIPSHGDLNPWRVLVQPDGSVQLLGYGLPPVAALAWLDEEVDTVETDALRHFPPERLEDQGEDVRSDLWAAALCAASLGVGHALPEGSTDAVLDGIYDGTVAASIEQHREALGADLTALLCELVRHDIAERSSDAAAIAARARAIAAQASGSSLAQLLQPQSVEPADTIIAAVMDPGPELEPLEPPASVSEVTQDVPHEPTEVGPPIIETPTLSEAPAPATLDLPEPPALDDDADLAAIRHHAQLLSTRAARLLSEADRMGARILASPLSTPPMRGQATEASSRASKAANTARTTLTLLELDDDAESARATWALVERAHRQAEEAALGVYALAHDLTRQAQAAEAAMQAKRRALAQCRQALEHALEAADETALLIERLMTAQDTGALTDPSALAAVREAQTASDRADAAAQATDEAVRRAEQGDYPGQEAKEAARQVQAAREQLAAAQAAHDRALAAQAQADARLVETVEAQMLEVHGYRERAARAQERAKDALQMLGPSGDEQDALRHQVQVAIAASSEAESCIGRMRSEALTVSEALKLVTAQAAVTRGAAEASERAAEALAERAGAAAAARARQEAIRDQARGAHTALVRQHAELVDDLEQLKARLAEVTSRSAQSALNAAYTDAQQAQTEFVALEAQVAATDTDDALRAFLGAAQSVSNTLEQANEHAHEAHEAAREQLKALADERAAAERLQRAKVDAQAQAKQARALVDAALQRLRQQAATVRAAGIAAADALCTQAEEIVDIAEFQATEAEQSARWAQQETLEDEAKAHAETARSYAERIELDLPEADVLLQNAQRLVDEIRDRLQAHIRRALDIEVEAKATHGEIRNLVDALDRDDEPAELEGDRARSLLDEAIQLASERMTEVVSAVARARGAQTPEAAQAEADAAMAAHSRLVGSRQQVQDRADAWKRAVQSARAKQQALVDLRAEVQAAAERANAALTAIGAVVDEADASVRAHGAHSPTVQQLRQQLTALHSEAKDAQRRTQEALQRVHEADLDPARALADTAGRATTEVERTLERAQTLSEDLNRTAADEAERRAAAQARERAAQVARLNQAQATIEEYWTALERAFETADTELEGCTDAAALDGRTKAQTSLDTVAHWRDTIRGLVDQTSSDTDPVAAKLSADRADTSLDAAEAAATEATVHLQEALDRARKFAKVTAALDGIHQEMAATHTEATQTLEAAQAHARAIVSLDMALDDRKALAGQCGELLNSLKRAIAKIEASAKMAQDADVIDTAQALLQACRTALRKTREYEQQIQGIVREAHVKIEQEQARAREALQAAQEQTAALRESAVASQRALKARLDAATSRADGRAPDALAALTERIAHHVKPLDQALSQFGDPGAWTDLATVQAASGALQAAMEGAAAQADALDQSEADLDARLDELERHEAAMRAARAAAQTVAQAVQEVAVQAGMLLTELQTWVEAHPQSSDRIASGLKEAQTSADRARALAEQARQSVEGDFPAPDALAAHMDQLQSDAIEALEAVMEADGLTREETRAFRRPDPLPSPLAGDITDIAKRPDASGPPPFDADTAIRTVEPERSIEVASPPPSATETRPSERPIEDRDPSGEAVQAEAPKPKRSTTERRRQLRRSLSRSSAPGAEGGPKGTSEDAARPKPRRRVGRRRPKPEQATAAPVPSAPLPGAPAQADGDADEKAERDRKRKRRLEERRKRFAQRRQTQGGSVPSEIETAEPSAPRWNRTEAPQTGSVPLRSPRHRPRASRPTPPTDATQAQASEMKEQPSGADRLLQKLRERQKKSSES